MSREDRLAVAEWIIRRAKEANRLKELGRDEMLVSENLADLIKKGKRKILKKINTRYIYYYRMLFRFTGLNHLKLIMYCHYHCKTVAQPRDMILPNRTTHCGDF